MTDLVSIPVRPAVAARLEKLALIAGSVSEAVERLLLHWEASSPLGASTAPRPSSQPQGMWRSSEGDLLPLGETLEANYKGRTYTATVERGGIRYAGQLHDTPTAAGRAVKRAAGTKGTATSTNGRTFWKLRNPATGKLVSIAELNPGQPIDVQRVLEDLRSVKPKVAS